MATPYLRSIVIGWTFTAAALLALLAPAQDRDRRTGPFTPVQERVSADLETQYQQMDEAVQKPLPKRAFKVKTGEPAKTKLFRADPKLLEKKFVATFSLVTKDTSQPDFQVSSRSGFGRDLREMDRLLANEPSVPNNSRFGGDLPITATHYPSDLRQLILVGDDVRLFAPQDSARHKAKPLSDYHQILLEKCADTDRPPSDMATFLTSADCNRDVIRFGREDSQAAHWNYSVFAATAQEAEQRAAAILQLLDGGVSRPLREYLLAQGRQSLAAARASFEEVATLSSAIRAEEEKLARPSEISPDILSQLKAQKVMVAVELAGLNARVKACDAKLRERDKLEAGTAASISDMKVKAEIERVGIQEKLDQINTFIGEGDSREAVQAKIAELKKTRSPIASRARSIEATARIYAALFDLYAPLPLQDDQLTISPVEWTN